MTVSNDPRGDSRLAAETVSLSMSMSTSKTTSVSFQDARLSAMRRSRDLPSLYGVSPREFAKSGEFALTKEGAVRDPLLPPGRLPAPSVPTPPLAFYFYARKFS